MRNLKNLQPFTDRMYVFFVVWFGQLISLTGSGLTSFALGVWVYQRTGSVTQLSSILLFAVLPSILISPVAGALVDRWNRRWCMIVSDSGAGLITAAIALLLVTKRLEIWHLYLAAGFYSAFKAFQLPAYNASTTLLVPKEYLSRATGMVQSGEAIAQLISPLLAGILLGIVHLHGVILIDFVTFVFGVTTLFLVRFPNAKIAAAPNERKYSLWCEAIEGWTYITVRPGLFVLLIVFAINNFVLGMIEVLFIPLVLTFTSVTVLGTIQSIGGTGMFLGSVVMSLWREPKPLIRGIFGFAFLNQLCILAFGLRTSAALFALANFFFFFSLPFLNSYCNAILLRKVAPDVQGRVFATINMICLSCIPGAYVIAGPLADRIFEPLMATNGLLAGSIGQFIGVGTGRGIALLFLTIEVLVMLVTVAAYRYPRLQLLEDELPDVI